MSEARPGKLVVNLATGIEENRERVMLAFFVAESALAQGREVLMFLSLEAVRIGIPEVIKGVIPCEGCPALDKLYNQLVRAGIEIYACPVCLNAREIDHADLFSEVTPAGTAKMMEWIGTGDATVFSY
ncbi:MAG: DsrE family protein [Actinobacteria bacterium]|nr:DsrE family protein [Actinomycetota bacterium]